MPFNSHNWDVHMCSFISKELYRRLSLFDEHNKKLNCHFDCKWTWSMCFLPAMYIKKRFFFSFFVWRAKVFFMKIVKRRGTVTTSSSSNNLISNVFFVLFLSSFLKHLSLRQHRFIARRNKWEILIIKNDFWWRRENVVQHRMKRLKLYRYVSNTE